MLKFRRAAFIVALALVTTAAFAANTPLAPNTTLANLQAAFNGESNAHARYLAFAQKADQEGFGEVASLFRAAASAEKIHAGNHAAVIKGMGGNAEAKIEAPTVKSTRENLEAAITGESYERDTMYPEFLKQARADRNRAALETLNMAKAAEIEHAKLYADALKNLATLKGMNKTYYVCSVCGMTVTSVNFAKCPSCFKSKDNYIAVS